MKYLYIGITFFILLLDQFIKWIVRKNMGLFESITIIPDFFHITYVENDGAAWNLFSGNKLFLIMIAILVLVVLYYFLLRNNKTTKREQFCYSLFIGGVLGNLSDRIFIGKVIDYLDFTIVGYHFPVFNLADICIVGGVILLIIDTLWGEYREKYCCNR